MPVSPSPNKQTRRPRAKCRTDLGDCFTCYGFAVHRVIAVDSLPTTPGASTAHSRSQQRQQHHMSQPESDTFALSSPDSVDTMPSSHASSTPASPSSHPSTGPYCKGTVSCFGIKVKRSAKACNAVSLYGDKLDDAERKEHAFATQPPFTRVTFPVSRNSFTRVEQGKQCVSPFTIFIKSFTEDEAMSSAADNGVQHWLQTLTPAQREARLRQVAALKQSNRHNRSLSPSSSSSSSAHHHNDRTHPNHSSSLLPGHSLVAYLRELREKEKKRRERSRAVAAVGAGGALGGAGVLGGRAEREGQGHGVSGWVRAIGGSAVGAAKRARQDTAQCWWNIKWSARQIKNTVADKNFRISCARELRRQKDSLLSTGSRMIKGGAGACRALVGLISPPANRNGSGKSARAPNDRQDTHAQPSPPRPVNKTLSGDRDVPPTNA